MRTDTLPDNLLDMKVDDRPPRHIVTVDLAAPPAIGSRVVTLCGKAGTLIALNSSEPRPMCEPCLVAAAEKRRR
jgi:hypothetical protein